MQQTVDGDACTDGAIHPRMTVRDRIELGPLRVADLAFALFAVVAIVIRAQAMARSGAPPGFDGGDWIGLGRGLFGTRIHPSGIVASPLTPLATYLSFLLVGARFTCIAFGAVLAIAPGAGVYAVLRRRIAPWDAALVSALVIFCAGTGEAASWGGYPQLIALGLLPVAVALVDRTFDRGERALAVRAGFLLLAVFLASDFVFTFAALAAAMLIALRLPDLVRLEHGWRRVAELLVATAAPLLLALPLAIHMVRVRVEAVLHPAGTVTMTPSALNRIDFVFSDRVLLWHAILAASLGAVVLLWERRFEIHWRLAASLSVIAFGLTVGFTEPRLAYLLPTSAALSVALWSPELRRLTRVPVFALLAAAACLVQLQALPTKARAQADWYQALTPKIVNGIDWVKRHSDGSALVAVTPYNDGPALGWWIEGLAGRRTLTASNLRWLQFDSERRTATQAAAIFANGVPTAIGLRQAKTLHVTLVFIDKRWSEYQSGRIAALRRDAPTAVAFENADVVVLRTSAMS